MARLARKVKRIDNLNTKKGRKLKKSLDFFDIPTDEEIQRSKLWREKIGVKEWLEDEDFPKIEMMLRAGCTVKECAHIVNMTMHNFTEQLKKHYKCDSLTLIKHSFWDEGAAILKCKQFDLAARGDVKMLMHLGKHRLNQKDNPVINYNVNTEAAVSVDNAMSAEQASELYSKMISQVESSLTQDNNDEQDFD